MSESDIYEPHKSGAKNIFTNSAADALKYIGKTKEYAGICDSSTKRQIFTFNLFTSCM